MLAQPSPPADLPITTELKLSVGNARWNDFRAYLQKLETTVHQRWDQLLSQQPSKLKTGTSVRISFIFSSEGKLLELVNSIPSEGCPNEERQACEAAVKASAPFDHWTSAMQDAFGFRQLLTLTFFYRDPPQPAHP